MDTKAMFKIGYGLYVLTAREGEKDNGCIVNTFQQVTDDPLRVCVAVNKANHTCGMIARTGVFNVSVIAEETATYSYYQRAIKPKPQPATAAPKRGWRCIICGYFYEGEELPKDFICPICKHPASDFERVG